jgi:hypothetical protein
VHQSDTLTLYLDNAFQPSGSVVVTIDYALGA